MRKNSQKSLVLNKGTWQVIDKEHQDVIAGIPTNLLSKWAVVLTGLDEAVMGYADPGILVYSYNQVVDHFVKQGMDFEEAGEWVAFNVMGLQATGDGFVMLYGPRC